MQIKQICVLNTKQRDIEEDYEEVCVDELVQYLSVSIAEVGGVAVVVQERGIFEMFSGFEDI